MIVLFALFLVVLLGAAAFVLDVARVYALQRFERSVADAAALAGAQDLQIPGTHGVNDQDYVNARNDALALLARELGGTPRGGSGTTSSGIPYNCAQGTAPGVNIVDCPIDPTPYLVSIKTDPSPSHVTVDAYRAVQVTVRQPNVPLTLSRIPPFGQATWNVGITSVAGTQNPAQYAVITLRPPAATDRTGNTGDITINGTGSSVAANPGDIGMNTGATLNGHSASVSVPDGYYVYYYGATATNQYSTPPGLAAQKQLLGLIPDPKYPIPSSSGVPAGGIDSPADCASLITDANKNGYPATGATCYTPGVYSSQLTIKNGDAALLEPGVYFFNGGLINRGILFGGYDPNSPGVALVVPQSQSFISDGGGGGSANVLALNRGTKYDLRAGGVGATAALNWNSSDITWDGSPVETNTTPPMLISVIVPGTPSCTVTVPAPSCTSGTIKWTGSGSATVTAVAGVVYAPSDNSQVAGNSDPKGYVGQVVSWTITYSGGSTLNQHFPGPTANGTVRLDQACSGANTPCTP